KSDVKYNLGVPDQAQVEFIAQQSFDTDIAVGGTLFETAEIDIKLGEFKVPLGQTGLIIEVPISLVSETIIEGNIQWGFRVQLDQRVGFISDISGKNPTPITDFNADFSGKDITVNGSLSNLFGVKVG